MAPYRGSSLSLVFTAVLALCCGATVVAQPAPASAEAGAGGQAEEEEELTRLLAVIEKYTDIATRTRLNADFVPGIVTVLHGDELAARGRRNIFEAIGDVPGMLPFALESGARNVAVRGNGTAIFRSGKVKFLINGVAQNSDYQGQVRPIWELPIEQIDYIEVIRGPGSAVHGEYAYDGVINVVTRSEGNQVFLRAVEDGGYDGGATFAWADEARDSRLHLNLFASGVDRGDVQSGPDAADPAASHAPGPVNDSREARSAVFSAARGRLELDAQYIHNGFGDQFGTNNQLPRPDDRIVYENTNTSLEARYRLAATESIDAVLRLGWFDYRFLARDALVLNNPFIGELFATADYEEQEMYAGVLVEGQLGQRHEWLLDMQLSAVDVEKADGSSNNAALLRDTDSFINQTEDRRYRGLTLQDQIRFSDRLSVTAGLRYDNYSDIGSELSPRLAVVWRQSERHILKAQYAEAFRPPTFLELYTENNPTARGNPELEPSESRSLEFGYIYRGLGTTARVTLFHNDLTNLIQVQPDSNRYENSAEAHSRGIELELEKVLSSTFSIDGNLSYADTKNFEAGGPLTGAAEWLANLGATYRLSDGAAVDARYRHVGERARGVDDPRPPLDGFDTLDLTLNLVDLLRPGLTLRAGVRNLLDDDIRHPALPGTYPLDYPQRGRQWWLQATYAF